MIARFSHQTPKVISETPAPGTKAFAKLFIETSDSMDKLGKAFACYLIDTLGATTAADGANKAQKEFQTQGFKTSSGYQTIRKDGANVVKRGALPRFSAIEYKIANACASAETAVKRELTSRQAPAIDVAKDVDAKLAGKTIDVPVMQLDEKGKARTALGDIKASGITGKAELARIFSELQQACVEENLDKISTLILEGQKILAIAK